MIRVNGKTYELVPSGDNPEGDSPCHGCVADGLLSLCMDLPDACTNYVDHIFKEKTDA